MLKEFREFAIRGNVIDMAVGIMVGAAFGTIVQSLVRDVLMPPIGMLLGNTDFSALFLVLHGGTPPGPYRTVADAQGAGAVTINYGIFINSIISFLIVALALFFVVRAINHLKRQMEQPAAQAAATQECPFCLSQVAIKATRCPFCTSQLS